MQTEGAVGCQIQDRDNEKLKKNKCWEINIFNKPHQKICNKAQHGKVVDPILHRVKTHTRNHSTFITSSLHFL